MVNRREINHVDIQKSYDPEFPPVISPNLMYEGALAHAIRVANSLFQTLIIANDLDAGCFRAAVKDPESGEWYQFTGDQMDVLLASFLLETAPAGVRIAVLTTIVSSGMLSLMARAHGAPGHVQMTNRGLEWFSPQKATWPVQFEETLAGFKWLGNNAHVLKEAGLSVLFGYEGNGYMFPSISFDKDGLAAASLFLLAADYWQSLEHKHAGEKMKPMRPLVKLISLYETYGYHETSNTYFTPPDPSYTERLFEQVRNVKWQWNERVGRFKVVAWR